MSVLYRGNFSTNIGSNITLVRFEIADNYLITANFRSKYMYTFKIDVSDLKLFDSLCMLMLNKFSDKTDEFGTITTEKTPIIFQGWFGPTKVYDNVKIPRMTEINKINVLKYICVDVFKYAEKIIVTYGHRSILDYCMYHKAIGKNSTYEQCIHLLACISLINTHYVYPDTEFPEIEFESDYDYTNITGITEHNFINK